MAPAVITGPELKKRLRAARELRGLRSDAALAKEIGEAGLGYGTMRAIQSGERPLRRSELLRVAEVLDISVGWFYEEDLRGALKRALPDPGLQIEQELGETDQQERKRRDDNEEGDHAQDGR